MINFTLLQSKDKLLFIIHSTFFSIAEEDGRHKLIGSESEKADVSNYLGSIQEIVFWIIFFNRHSQKPIFELLINRISEFFRRNLYFFQEFSNVR